MNRVLLVAYHYPPCRGSSGLQRTLSFSRYLPQYGWRPVVLAANPRAYPAVGDDQLQDIPAGVPLRRAFALDTARHLSVNGKYFGWMALPDRWISWVAGAVPAGLWLIRRYRPRLIWSTYPIATAHLIGCALHRLSGVPWVADFRDPMVEESFPTDPGLRSARLWVEKLCVTHAARAIFCTSGAREICAERYPGIPRSRWGVVANGYDEQAFAAAEQARTEAAVKHDRIVLLHSGLLYPGKDRDPTAFFDAIARMQGVGVVSPGRLRVVLRASGFEDHYRRLIKDRGLDGIIHLGPAVSYREALTEMLTADGLLVFQGAPSNPAIPAKLYEYLRARRPILAMVDSEGETARLLRDSGVGAIVPLEDADSIAQGLAGFLGELSCGRARIASSGTIKQHSREVRTAELAAVFDDVVGPSGQ